SWSSSNPSIATVNSAGLVTGISPGQATISATTNDGSFKATAEIFVTDSFVFVNEIIISPEVETIDLGESQKFTALVSPNNATNKAISWYSSNSAVGTITQNGVFNALMPGATTIMVSAKDGSDIYETKLVKVVDSSVYLNIEDVNQGDFAEAEVWEMYQRGYSTGCKYETFANEVFTKYCPNNPVKREQMAAFLYALAGAPAYTPPKNSPFLDLDASNIFYKQIMWGVDNGIWSGYPSGNFLPGKQITRSQFVTTLWRFYGSPKPNFPLVSPFTDVKSTDAFYEPVLWAVANGITAGYNDGSFKHAKYCTRAQMAIFVIKADDKY
ncbi:MAG: Ig-like domain-containing protein, partial [Bifidobacteriaceae bacterium]|nr:Ig-like domain-containing protein [Bifidobacteriaceae bacterium]